MLKKKFFLLIFLINFKPISAHEENFWSALAKLFRNNSGQATIIIQDNQSPTEANVTDASQKFKCASGCGGFGDIRLGCGHRMCSSCVRSQQLKAKIALERHEQAAPLACAICHKSIGFEAIKQAHGIR